MIILAVASCFAILGGVVFCAIQWLMWFSDPVKATLKASVGCYCLLITSLGVPVVSFVLGPVTVTTGVPLLTQLVIWTGLTVIVVISLQAAAKQKRLQMKIDAAKVREPTGVAEGPDDSREFDDEDSDQIRLVREPS